MQKKVPNIKIHFHRECNAGHTNWDYDYFNSLLKETFNHEDEIAQLQL